MIYALLGALAVGVSLGLLGSGGSILTVPVLVYLLGRPEKAAIAESLAIVGGIAAAGAALHARRGAVRWSSALLFGVPGMIGSFLGAFGSKYVSGALQLTIFACVMLAAATLMVRGVGLASPATDPGAQPRRGLRAAAPTIAAGLAVGALTGFVGVGGGFLIVPALVLLMGLPMGHAVGTSLVVIVMNCAVGFLKHQRVLPTLGLETDWTTIGLFIAVGAAGTFAGSAIAGRLKQTTLRKLFGLFLLAMAAFVLYREAPHAIRDWAANHANNPAPQTSLGDEP
ncbi:MAG TPA: sulfite exporter TauE/SafE family protein [Phycisphaerales bacterium]|nr:sulfite exporter TauE/SafE family protein [Phycisphaerales bacterium]